LVLHLDVEKWHRASESARQASLPVICQAASIMHYAARQTDMIM
jgi:hypothetical protein